MLLLGLPWLAAVSQAGPEEILACHEVKLHDPRLAILKDKLPLGRPLQVYDKMLNDTSKPSPAEARAIAIWAEGRKACLQDSGASTDAERTYIENPKRSDTPADIASFNKQQLALTALIDELRDGQLSYGEFNQRRQAIALQPGISTETLLASRSDAEDILDNQEADQRRRGYKPQPARPPISATEDAALEKTLLSALAWDRSAHARHTDSSVAIRAYQKAGAIHRHRDGRVDYSNEYLLRKNTHLLGQELFALEDEVMYQYIGCCIDQGITATLRLGTDTQALRKFADANRCELRQQRRVPEIFDVLETAPAPGRYAELSCHSRAADDNP